MPTSPPSLADRWWWQPMLFIIGGLAVAALQVRPLLDGAISPAGGIMAGVGLVLAGVGLVRLLRARPSSEE